MQRGLGREEKRGDAEAGMHTVIRRGGAQDMAGVPLAKWGRCGGYPASGKGRRGYMGATGSDPAIRSRLLNFRLGTPFPPQCLLLCRTCASLAGSWPAAGNQASTTRLTRRAALHFLHLLPDRSIIPQKCRCVLVGCPQTMFSPSLLL